MVQGRMGADGEDKKLARLIKNREAAQQARDKKKQYIGELEAENDQLKKKITDMETKFAELEKQCLSLSEVCLLLKGRGDIYMHIHMRSFFSTFSL